MEEYPRLMGTVYVKDMETKETEEINLTGFVNVQESEKFVVFFWEGGETRMFPSYNITHIHCMPMKKPVMLNG